MDVATIPPAPSASSVYHGSRPNISTWIARWPYPTSNPPDNHTSAPTMTPAIQGTIQTGMRRRSMVNTASAPKYTLTNATAASAITTPSNGKNTTTSRGDSYPYWVGTGNAG